MHPADPKRHLAREAMPPSEKEAYLQVLDAARRVAPGPLRVEDLPGDQRQGDRIEDLVDAGFLDRPDHGTVLLTGAADAYYELLELDRPTPPPIR